MSQITLCPDQINALTSFSVGTLDDRDAMMVLEVAVTSEDFCEGARCQVPLTMTPEMARDLAYGLMAAADCAEMGPSPTIARN
ncbi:hypothetical protein VB618_12090 [Microvirga sp. CF3062]|uniref:hypothetical protein n=1 Tax=Microvirga sp. CF3062 TaxID=3110182 RepID=UPI002E791A6D|nr:hypothetical protein [Microvirga sp. CF3062]MEE1656940.1 hypothetical protein [Microvirga sp. CF3062]